MPEGVRNRAHLHKKERRCNQGQRGLARRRALEVDEMEVEVQQRGHDRAGQHSPGNARQRTLIITMRNYLKKSEKIHVGISELKHLSLAKNARNEWALQLCSDRNELRHRSG